MKRIFKYPIPHPQSVIEIPHGAEILSVGVQGDEIMVWALVDEQEPVAKYVIRVYATGEQVPYAPGTYLGTVQLLELVWHIYLDRIR